MSALGPEQTCDEPVGRCHSIDLDQYRADWKHLNLQRKDVDCELLIKLETYRSLRFF